VRTTSCRISNGFVSLSHFFSSLASRNGCGKTTIIECLKYAITGGLPPGNKSGQAFVHGKYGVRTQPVLGAAGRSIETRAIRFDMHEVMWFLILLFPLLTNTTIDPRQSGSKQTKATVKLRFNTRQGQPTVVIRSMELTRSKTTLSFKQLDGVIRSSDPVTGARNSLSHKCSELDSTLPAMLGVTKAILDNVLFCHQEEASWPLQEGAVLKKKFDDIFDS
jgi:DNA repair exonuclease SbcCD ATPase subunit